MTDDFELVRRLVSRTDAFYPLMHTSESFGGLDREFLMIRNAVEMPLHHVSYARAPNRPKTAVISALEDLLLKRIGTGRPTRESSRTAAVRRQA